MIVFGQKFLYSGKSGCIRAKLLYWGKSGCIPENVVLFDQGGCIWAKVLVFGLKWLYRECVVELRKKWFSSGKESLFG